VTLFEPSRRVKKIGSLNERLDNLPLMRVDSASTAGSDVTGCSGEVLTLPPEAEWIKMSRTWGLGQENVCAPGEEATSVSGGVVP
jgi:hypothetical protein